MLLFERINRIFVEIYLIVFEEIVALHICGNAMLFTVGVDDVSARIKEEQGSAELSALTQYVYGVVAVAEKLIGTVLAEAMLEIGKILEKQVLVKAPFLANLMVSENCGPIYSELFHHGGKLNCINLLSVRENNVTGKHNKVGLCVFDVAYKIFNRKFIVFHAVVKMKVGARKNNKILIRHVSVGIKFCNGGGKVVGGDDFNRGTDILGICFFAKQRGGKFAAAETVYDFCEEKINSYQCLPDESPNPEQD